MANIEKIVIDGSTMGQYFRSLRRLKHLSTHQVAELAGLSSGYVNKIELDNCKTPEINKIKKLAEVLEVDQDRLLQYLGYNDKPKHTNNKSNVVAYLRDQGLDDESIAEVFNFIKYAKIKQVVNGDFEKLDIINNSNREFVNKFS